MSIEVTIRLYMDENTVGAAALTPLIDAMARINSSVATITGLGDVSAKVDDFARQAAKTSPIKGETKDRVVKSGKPNKDPAPPAPDANATGNDALSTSVTQPGSQAEAGSPSQSSARAEGADADSSPSGTVSEGSSTAGGQQAAVTYTPEQVRDVLSKLRDSGKLPRPGDLVKSCVKEGSISKATPEELVAVMKRVEGM